MSLLPHSISKASYMTKPRIDGVGKYGSLSGKREEDSIFIDKK